MLYMMVQQTISSQPNMLQQNSMGSFISNNSTANHTALLQPFEFSTNILY